MKKVKKENVYEKSSPFVNKYITKIENLTQSNKSNSRLFKDFFALLNEWINDDEAQNIIPDDMKEFISNTLISYCKIYEQNTFDYKFKNFISGFSDSKIKKAK